MPATGSKRPRKLHLGAAALVFLTAYLPLGYLFLDRVYPSLETAPQILISLLIPAPVFMMLAGWLWIENRLQRGLIHHLPSSPMPASQAQLKTERKASIRNDSGWW